MSGGLGLPKLVPGRRQAATEKGNSVASKPMLVLLLSLLCLAANAQEAPVPVAQTPEPVVVEQPSLAPVFRVMASSRQFPGLIKVRLEWDETGRVLDAKADPSTRNPELDRAVRKWAMQLRLKPGGPGTGWVPLTLRNGG